jgi:hypothetical protein
MSVPTQAKTGFGTLLKRGAGDTNPGPETFTSVGELLSIKGPKLTRAMITATNMGSPNGRRQVIASGILEIGPVDFQVSYVRGDAQHVGILSDIKNGTLRNWQIVFPDDPTNPVGFAAYVTSAEPDMPIAEKRTLTVSVEVTDDITNL